MKKTRITAVLGAAAAVMALAMTGCSASDEATEQVEYIAPVAGIVQNENAPLSCVYLSEIPLDGDIAGIAETLQADANESEVETYQLKYTMPDGNQVLLRNKTKDLISKGTDVSIDLESVMDMAPNTGVDAQMFERLVKEAKSMTFQAIEEQITDAPYLVGRNYIENKYSWVNTDGDIFSVVVDNATGKVLRATMC